MKYAIVNIGSNAPYGMGEKVGDCSTKRGFNRVCRRHNVNAKYCCLINSIGNALIFDNNDNVIELFQEN